MKIVVVAKHGLKNIYKHPGFCRGFLSAQKVNSKLALKKEG